uniref:Uncharacterized protein n=1 Tax=Oryza brachyantha TaxID=4533 RepID=J3MEA5_ORYBR
MVQSRVYHGLDEEIVISTVGQLIYVFCLMSNSLSDFWICKPLSMFCFILSSTRRLFRHAVPCRSV